MGILDNLTIELGKTLPFVEVALVIILLIVLFNVVLLFIKKKMLQRAKTKEQISNIKILSRILNVAFVVGIVIIGFLSYIKSWTGIGVVLGLFTAALGFALQKPITGIAAWIMVIMKRPFQVGDRITVGKYKGDVYDISLTHLYLDEVGGIAETEQHSGRNIMVPNHILFEEAIINHTLRDDFVIGEITFSVTYESNLDRAIEIAEQCASELTKDALKAVKKTPKVRVSMADNGVILKVNYYTPVQSFSKVKSDITKLIFDRIKKQEDVDFAYPHMKVLYKDKRKKKRDKPL